MNNSALATNEIYQVVNPVPQTIKEVLQDEMDCVLCHGCGEPTSHCICTPEMKIGLKEIEYLANWHKINASNICCKKAEPIEGGCVGSFCCQCPDHGQTHLGSHE